jgi:hypothetical protein
MMESLVFLRQAGGATVTDAFDFRETARNVPRGTDRTRGGAKPGLAFASYHCGFRARIGFLACLVVARETGFIGDSYDYFDEDAKCVEVGV